MATLYFRSTGTNWGTAGDWSTTPYPSYTGGSVPTTADDVIFEAASANCIVNSINRVCKTIDFTNYTNTIQMTFNITVSGAITFGASMNVHVTGSGSIGSIVTSTITPNGFAWPNTFTLGGTNQTYTLASNMTLAGQLTCSGATAVTINSNTLTCNNGAVFTTATSGTTTIELKGGNWSGTCNNTLNLDSAGTITLTGNIVRSSGTLTYVTGTINNSGNYSLGMGSASSINVGNNILWNNITFGIGTTTLVSDLHASGNMITAGSGIINGAYTIYCTGITQNNWAAAVAGTATVELTGTGVWSIVSSYGWGFNTIINCGGANTLTINTGVYFGAATYTPTLTYTSGNIAWAGAGIITFLTSTLATSGMTFNNVRMGISSIGTQTITLSNNMTVSGDLTTQGNGVTIINGNQINLAGSFINNQVGVSASGTTIINMNGTGSISTTGTPTSWTNPITINSSGTITWSGSNTYSGNLVYTNGTIVSTGSTLLRPAGTMTINATGFNLGTLSITGNSYFFGTDGFTIATLNNTTAGVHSIWQVGNEYIITDNFISGQINASNRITYTSSDNRIFTGSIAGSLLSVTAVAYGTIAVGDEIFATGLTQGFTITSLGSGTGGLGTYNLSGSPGTLLSRTIVSTPNSGVYPKITLQNGAYQNLYYSNALDVDSTLGQTIWTFDSNLKRAFNWALGTRPTQRTFISVS
jgi:hypothetical protein